MVTKVVGHWDSDHWKKEMPKKRKAYLCEILLHMSTVELFFPHGWS